MDSTKRAFLSWAIIAFVLPFSVQATVLYVPSNYATIQAGINSATSGDTVLVSPGFYEENINLGIENVTLGSSFLTTGDSSYIINTIIDGDSSGPVITITGGQDNLIICGFTIQNGFAQRGGGIYCDSLTRPTIYNNNIHNNCATANGGGLYGYFTGSKIVKNRFENNSASSGGGAYFRNSSILFDSNLVSNNKATSTAGGGGGGIVCFGTSSPRLVHNKFLNNIAYDMGGGISAEFCDVIIDSNIISNNHYVTDGGGVFTVGANAVIVGNIICFNTYIGNLFTRGGGIFSMSDQLLITDNIIYENSASASGGGASCRYSTNSLFSRNIVSNNRCDQNAGGLALVEMDNVIISNNSIINNSAGSQGGGIFCFMSTLNITNSIIRGNKLNDTISQIGFDSTTISIRFTNIQGGWSGEGNIDCDPMFCDPDNGNYYLAENSCCATAGDSGQYIGALGIGCYRAACNYLLGDINADGQRLGGDVTFGVRYFKSIGSAPPDSCFMDSTSTYLYVAGDVNGNCEFRGSDITRLVSFFKGTAVLANCHFFPPAP